MLGKLIAWGGDRAEAIARMKSALREYYASGIKTNVALFQRILQSHDFENGAIYTRWLDDFLAKEKNVSERGTVDDQTANSVNERAAAIALALWHNRSDTPKNANGGRQTPEPSSRWKADGRVEQMNGKLGS